MASLAIAQPLFAVLASGPDFFVAHDSRPGDLILFAASIYLVPPLLLWLGVKVVSRFTPRGRIGKVGHTVVLAALAGALLLPWLDRLGAGALFGPILAVAAGVGFALAVERSPGLRSFLTLLAPLTLAAPLLFLLLPPVSDLVRPRPISGSSVEVADPATVVLVIFDELPIVSLLDADRTIDADLFPNFAALAATSYWFPDATSVSSATNEAVPAILTGRYPSGEEAAIASEHPRSLFTLLGEQYDFRVSETQTRLCPRELCPPDEEIPRTARLARLLIDASVVYAHIVTPAGLRRHLPPISATWTDFLALERAAPASTESTNQGDDAIVRLDIHIFASDRTRVFERFLESLTPREEAKPRLHFLHVMLPHVPWVYLPSGKEYWGSLYSSALAHGVGRDTVWPSQAWLVAQGYQRHMLQLVFVDRLLGRLMERLEATGLADEAIVVVTADHGLSFQAGQPGRTPTAENFADIMAVPLFLHTPGQTDAIVDHRNVEVVDILPTLADLLGVELAWAVDGQSMLGSGPQRPLKVLFDRGHRRTYRPAALERRFDSLARKLEIFDGGLFGIGPRPEILERPVAELPFGRPAGVQVRLDQAEQFRRVALDSGYLPAQVFGRVRKVGSNESLDLEIAVAVNGIVRAVTRTFVDNGTRFAAMVPEESFVEGENRVDVFVVESRGADLVLRATERHRAPVYSLGRDADGEVVRLEASDGTTCHLDPSAVEGAYYRHGTGFTGWARDARGERPYVVIMTFADGRLVHTVTTGVEPPPEAAVAGDPGYETSGFRFVLPASVIDSSRDLRLYAVVGEQGSELPLREGGEPYSY